MKQSTNKKLMKFRFILTLTVAFLSGCYPWPRAEHQSKVYTHMDQFALDRQTQNELYDQLLIKDNRLNRLRFNGVKRCFPGRWLAAYLLLNRTRIEINGGYFNFARKDLHQLNHQLRQLERSKKWIGPKGVCQLTKRPAEIAQQHRQGY